MNTSNITDYTIGDLVHIIELKDASSFFKWTDLPISGIYMGELEATHYFGSRTKEKTICFKIWALGKTRYISSLEEIKLLASIKDAS